MKAISKHPIEWDFNKIKQDKVCETRGKAPIDENKCCDIAADLRTADSKLFGENSFYFLCPPYFYNKMDELGLFEFNPYEGKIFEDVYGFIKPAPKINMAQPIIDNPGFATEYVYGVGEKNPNSNNFGAVTGFFNEHYPKQGPNYYHEGVDFRGTVGTRIKCLIHAKVIAYGWMPDSGYGQVVWLYNVDGEGIYLLAHLNSYDSKIAVGKEYFPGETVAYVGASGHGKLNYWDGPHLHLSYHKKKYDKNFIQQKTITMINNNVILGNGYSMIREARRDPFYHNSIKHKGFGK